MSARANRRGSVEIQHLTQWKHQQNLEEIKLLKAGGTATAAGTSVASQGTAHVLQSPAKLSKLAARLQRNGADQVASVLSTPMRKEEPRPDQHMSKPVLFQPPAVIIAHHENYGDLSSSPMAVASVGLGSKSELEALLKEKQHWLRVMHEDNGKMAVLLKDLNETKIQLGKKMQELENERRAIRQATVPDDVEIFLTQDCDIASDRRDRCIPVSLVGRSVEVQRELLDIAKEFRVNQAESREFFYKTLRQAVAEFVAWAAAEEERAAVKDDADMGSEAQESESAEEGWLHQLTVLRALAAAGPGNVRAAEGLAASVASAVIRAAGERGAGLLQLHQTAAEKRHVLSLQDEIVSLRKENAELKAGLAKMRKSNVQLRMKATASAMLRPSSPSVAGPGSAPMSDSEGEGRGAGKPRPAWQASVSAEEKSDDDGDAFGSGDDEPEASLEDAAAQLAAAGETSNLLDSSDRLPRVVSRYLSKELAAHARLVVEGHPLAASVSGAMVDRLTKDLSREVQGIAAAAFFAFMHHRQGLAELPDCLLDGTVASIDDVSAADSPLSPSSLRAVEQVREAVDHVLQVSSVHTELSALATLYLTYLHCRAKPGDAAGSQQADLLVLEDSAGGPVGSAQSVGSRASSHSAYPLADQAGGRPAGLSSGGAPRFRKIGMAATAAAVMRSSPAAKHKARADAPDALSAAQSAASLRNERLQSPSSPLPRYMQAKGKR